MLVAIRRDLRGQAPQGPLASDQALRAQLQPLHGDVARPVQELALQEIAAGAVVRVRGVEPADGSAAGEDVDGRGQVRVHEVRARRTRCGRKVDGNPAIEGRRLGPAGRPVVAGGMDGGTQPEDRRRDGDQGGHFTRGEVIGRAGRRAGGLDRERDDAAGDESPQARCRPQKPKPPWK
jgi:hypothetical protein